MVKKSWFLGFVLGVFFCNILFAQIITYSQEQEKLDDIALKKDILERVSKAPRWVAYKAFVMGNTSLCDKSNSGKNCWSIVQNFVFLKKLTKRDCTKLPEEFKDLADYCAAINNQNCFDLTGFEKTMCNALLSRDTNLMIKAFSDPEFPGYLVNKKDSAEAFVNIYYGFKEGKEEACSRFTSENQLLKASCNMLFGNRSYESKINAIVDDIFYAAKAKKTKKKDWCSKIRNSQIADVCNDDSVADLNRVFEIVWL